MTRPVTITPVDAGDPLDLLPRLADALTGEAPILPYAGASPGPATLPDRVLRDSDPGLPAGLALVVATSGSTGTPKYALLTAEALRASAAATESALGGAGQWLLAIPAHHIAGLQVLLRSLHGHTAPVVLDRRDGFRPAGFAAATARLTADRTYTSLVPTQVGRLLEDETGRAALRRFTAVLVGGAALPPRLRAAADAAGIRLVATYGMTETAGGCVYDGRPLAGVRVDLGTGGRIRLGGPTLAAGYLGNPDATAAAFADAGTTDAWFRTDDLGTRDAEGRLHVLGRADDVVNTGGNKVHPRLVEEAVLAAFPELTAAVAVGVPDPEWGAIVAVTVVGAPVGLDEVRNRLRGRVPAYALPRRIALATTIPERGPGKPDRRAVARSHGLGEMGQ